MAKAKIVTNQIDIEILKTKKIDELNVACNKSILDGFISTALGSNYMYDFDYEAQINFAGMLTNLNANASTETIIPWKTNLGIVNHTVDQFKQVFNDGLNFKQNKIGQYWIKKQTVLSAVSVDEINAVTFN
jgi:archaellum component FlaF (FlaF/FlaG flagellin family)